MVHDDEGGHLPSIPPEMMVDMYISRAEEKALEVEEELTADWRETVFVAVVGIFAPSLPTGRPCLSAVVRHLRVSYYSRCYSGIPAETIKSTI